MSRLKTENAKMCFSLLREFIDEAQTSNNKKGIARLALDQLQRISGGKSPASRTTCVNRPRME